MSEEHQKIFRDLCTKVDDRSVLDAAIERIAQLEAELETGRMRLAACGVVALANTRGSAEIARDMLPQYRSGSCEEVEKAVDREMALRDRVEQLEAENKHLREALEARRDWFAAQLKGANKGNLSLIHISEPTRPY